MTVEITEADRAMAGLIFAWLWPHRDPVHYPIDLEHIAQHFAAYVQAGMIAERKRIADIIRKACRQDIDEPAKAFLAEAVMRLADELEQSKEA